MLFLIILHIYISISQNNSYKISENIRKKIKEFIWNYSTLIDKCLPKKCCMVSKNLIHSSHSACWWYHPIKGPWIIKFVKLLQGMRDHYIIHCGMGQMSLLFSTYTLLYGKGKTLQLCLESINISINSCYKYTVNLNLTFNSFDKKIRWMR